MSFISSFLCSATLACQSVQGLSWCIISLRYHLILGKEKWFSHSDSGFLVSMYDTILHSFVFTISILSSCLNEIVDDHVLHPCICYSWRPSVVSDDTRLCRTVTAGDFVSVAEWRAITIYIVEPLCISINSSARVCWIVIGIRYMRLKLDREHYLFCVCFMLYHFDLHSRRIWWVMVMYFRWWRRWVTTVYWYNSIFDTTVLFESSTHTFKWLWTGINRGVLICSSLSFSSVPPLWGLSNMQYILLCLDYCNTIT